ncbi:MAG: zinc transporter ZupT [Deltaproteobacteria bacterium]|nr:zinc transporter ZupT [Deltaproteobacteria bacterium]
MNNVLIAIGLTLFAGMATGIGSILAFFAKKDNHRFLSLATGFSAGVMLYVSFAEIFFKGLETLVEQYGERLGNWINVASFFGGILLIGVIDRLIPAAENPHEIHSESENAFIKNPLAPAPCTEDALSKREPGTHDHSPGHNRLMRMGLFTALAIGIHNFPEGLATFLAALDDPSLGIAIAVAIALHNIPEGISVSVPIFYATGNRKKAFLLSLLSGLAEPVGAVAAYILLRFVMGWQTSVVPQGFMAVMFGGVAGIMVYISLDELIPTSRAYGKGHDSIIGLVTGMAVMALSLLMFK